MKIKNLISLLLSVVMVLGVAVPVMANPEETAVATSVSGLEGYEFVTKSSGTDLYVNKETGDVNFVLNGKVLFTEQKAAKPTIPDIDKTDKEYDKKMNEFFNYYKSTGFMSPQEYVAVTMKYIYDNHGYMIFADEITGAMAFLEIATGQILLTNPYDAGATKSNDKTKSQLLSQFVFDYVKGTNGDTFSTFEQAAKNFQVKVKRIRGGVRVEYTVGRQEARILLPMMIEEERFKTEILDKINIANKSPDASLTPEQLANEVARDKRKLEACYTLMSVENSSSEKAKRDLILKYPILKKYSYYQFNDPSMRLKYEVEAIIKEYTDYTFENIQEDHELLEYTGNEATPALFKMSIEYYLDENGLKIRVPAKSINYNKSAFTITALRILPFLGAGNQGETGYTFYPDGSGTLVRFEDIAGDTRVISGKVYGQDYAYYATSGQNKEVMRLPAFGVKRDENYTVVESFKEYQLRHELDGTIFYEDAIDYFGVDAVADMDKYEPDPANVNPTVDGRTAFLAYMEEGDSMVQISTDHGGVTHKYHTAYATVYPEMSDSYALTGISSSGDAKWTVDIDRGYTGNYTFRVFMLSGDKANYNGMAVSLREYLLAKGDLVKNEIDDPNIPLFLENFGSIKTTQKVVGIPVTENTKLTTFEQSEKMITELKEAGVSNINLKLTGWYNGGMEHTVPSKLKVQKAIGGTDGLKELGVFAKENQVGLYPDLEFTYVDKDKMFDGFNYKKQAVRTVDNKAASHRVYSALYQGFEEDDLIVVNADEMIGLYDDVRKKYNKFEIGGLSVSSLGSDLNSDNGKELAMTREEAKTAVTTLLSDIQKDGNKILVSGGNAYTYAYADIITDLPLDSSRNIYTTEAVPFLGMVLHGAIEYSGTAINLDGDFGYSVLKCIENGASPYFILSYTDDEVDNTSELKSFDRFSKYYSIKYDIWKEDLVETYKKLNDALSSVQAYDLTAHERFDEDIVKVTYTNGADTKSFVLNYGVNEYVYEGKNIEPLGFIALEN